MTSEAAPPPGPRRRNRRDTVVAAICGAVVALMVGMSYAAVPFYGWFCKVTGFGGIPQVAHTAPTQTSGRSITVRFDANVGAGLPWRFEPEQTAIETHLGEVVTVYYRATNLSQHETGAQAAYNVAPTTVGSYFTKINCFCFSEQHLGPGETRDMAVVFYVDTELAADSDQDDLNTITLSYTFYPVRGEPARGAAAASDPGRKT